MSSLTKDETVFSFSLLSIACILGICLVLSYLCIRLTEDKTGLTQLYMLMLVQLTPLIISFSRKLTNYISLIMFNHFLNYSIAKYNQAFNISSLGHLRPEAIIAIEELMLCSVLIILSYYAFRQLVFYRFVVRERYEYLYLGKYQTVVLGLYECFSSTILNVLPRTFHTLHFVISAAGLVLLFCCKAPGYERLLNGFKLGTILNVALYFVQTSSMALLGSLVSTLFMVFILKREYKKISYLVLTAFVMSGLQPVKSAYREMLNTGQLEPSITGKLKTIGGLIYDKYFLGQSLEPVRPVTDEAREESSTEVENEMGSTLLRGFARIGDDSLERVLSWTPSIVPFWKGDTYQNIPYMFVPRFLWPDKPRWTSWNKFGREYGVLSSDDYSTSVGVSYLAEAYMNFGYSAMYICAVFFGFFTALIERLSYFYMRGHFYFTFICFLVPLMTYAADLGSMLNSIVLMTSIMLAFRFQFIKMARRDSYSL